MHTASRLPPTRARARNPLLSQLLGWDLTAERHRRRTTQQQLAAALNVDVATVSRWENGHGLPCAQHQLTLRRWFADELAA